MHIISIPLHDRAYDLLIGRSIFESKPVAAAESLFRNRRCFIVSDRNVDKLYGSMIRGYLQRSGAQSIDEYVFRPGEKSKNLRTVEKSYKKLINAGFDRKSIVVALGGGVVGDTAGFVAATFMRGIDFVQIPTTLVAQVDSSIGGKTGIDLPEGKNLVGAFYQPRLVLIDVSTLTTLPLRQLRCGLAEVVKYGVIMDEKFFQFLEDNVTALLNLNPEVYERVIRRCCELKAEIVVEDERDQGLRAILNYGHTFGHALVKLSGYAGLTHGEAIAIGMGIAADLARLRSNDASMDSLVKRQDSLFRRIGLPTSFAGFPAHQVAQAMRTDKKFVDGKFNLILPDRMGAAKLVFDVPEDEVFLAIGGRCE